MRFFNKLIAIFVIACICAISGGCSSESKNAAKESFENMMNAFKECNKEEINKYYSFSAVTAYIDEASSEEYQEAVLSTLKSMDYKVNAVKDAGENAVVINVEITTLNFSKIIERYIEDVMELVDSKEYQLKVKSMTADEYKTLMADKMVAAISESDGEKITKAVDVVMINSGDKWVLGGDADAFLGVLFADISNAVQSLT